MFSRLPPRFGETPTKIVFEGVEPGSAAAQLLYHRHQAEISHFHSKARQSRTISEQPGSSMAQALPGGGRLRYAYNGGQETVHVRLEPREVAEALRERIPPELHRADPVLAIDVLFDAHLYLAGDVFAYTEEEVITSPGTPEVPDTYTESLNFDGVTGAITTEQVVAQFPEGAVETVEGTRVLNLDATTTFISGYATYLDSVVETSSPPPPEVIQTVVTIKFVDDGFHDYGFGIGGRAFFTLSILDRQPGTPATPPTTRTDKHYTRETRSFFDVLDMVGAVGDPEAGEPYEAKSTGETADGRLIPCSLLSVSKAISRSLVASDTAPPGFIGAGFVAQPKEPQRAGEAPSKTIIDIYVASINTSKINEFPGGEGATFAVDDPSFTYEAIKQLSLRVRCREFADTTPVGVKVTTTTGQKRQEFTAPGANAQPTIAGPELFESSSPSRTVEWHFAAGSKWTAGGNEPADPTAVDDVGASTMGELLAEAEFTEIEVEGPEDDPLQRKNYTEIRWAGSVAGMTKICRVVWTPPARSYFKGKADIE